MTTAPPRPRPTALDRLRSLPRARGLVRELVAFGGVGFAGFLVDLAVFNGLRASVLPDDVILAKIVSVTVATVVAWIGHRYLTFGSRRGLPVAREVLLFALANVGGLLIAAACLGISHYGLGLHSALADNVSGNVIGLVLATTFRFACYRLFVFRAPRVLL